jgi:hypothetical protein
LIVTVATRFPKRCVHCGSRRGTRRDRHTFERVTAAVAVGYLTVFAALGPLLAMIVGAKLRKVVTVELSRCKDCRNREIGARQLVGVVVVGVTAGLFGAGAVGLNGGSKALTAALLAIAVGVPIAVGRSLNRTQPPRLRALRQGNGGVWVAGVHPDVLAMFPHAERASIEV